MFQVERRRRLRVAGTSPPATTAAVGVQAPPALALQRTQRSAKSVAELVSERAVDYEVGRGVGDFEDEGESTRDVGERAADRDAAVRADEHLGREVADGEDDHDDDDDARHAVLVAAGRRHGRR